MKIITRNKIEGELCYVQVKDILFLARLTKNTNVMQQYLDLINSGKGENDFVRITQIGYINAIKKCDYIVDFCEFNDKNIPVSYISDLIVSMSFALNSEKEKECLEHKSDDLRDIMAYKRGELEYRIPLVVNGSFDYVNEEGTLYFDGTTVDGCFVIKTIDGSDISSVDYTDFYLNCLDKIYEEVYPDVVEADRLYTTFNNGNIFVIWIRNSEKKKESRIGRLLSKLKKGSK